MKFFRGVFFSWVLFSFFPAWTQIGTSTNEIDAYDGYTLFHPHENTSTFLINNDGKLVHQWLGTRNPGNTVKLLSNGLLLRTGSVVNNVFTAGGSGGYVELVNWSGEVVWSYELSSESEIFHHEIIVLPNGNFLGIVWDRLSYEEAVELGRNPENLSQAGFWSEKLIEFELVGSSDIHIVWEWDAIDHVVQNFDPSKANYSESISVAKKLDINYVGANDLRDWIHMNSVHFNEELNLIVVSSPFFNELWVIDHSTTTEQSASSSGGRHGKGGDILYRWGNPAPYDNGTTADRKFYGQHNVQWFKDGDVWKFLYYNNGAGRVDGNYSTIETITAPLDVDGFFVEQEGPFGPDMAEILLGDDPQNRFYSRIVSGAQVMSNGNILVCVGQAGRFIEFDQSKDVVWEYFSPLGRNEELEVGINCTWSEGFLPSIVFRAEKYSKDFVGFGAFGSDFSFLHDLGCEPLGVIPSKIPRFDLVNNELLALTSEDILVARLFDLNGREIYLGNFQGSKSRIKQILNPGIYVVIFMSEGVVRSQKVLAR